MTATNTSVLATILLATVLSPPAYSQEFTMKNLEMAGDNLIIHYDLLDSVKNRTYTISVFSSKDDFLSPLPQVKGDVGLEVRPGTNRKIIWPAKEALGAAFSGKVSFEIRGRVYVPFVRFTGFSDYKLIKRAKPYVVTWTGGTRQNILNFDLYNGEDKVWTEAGVANTGNFELTIPSSVRPGKNYHFRISDSKNKDEVVNTGTFTIKRKIPLAMKVIPLLAAGGIVYLLGGGTDGPEPISDPLKPTDQNKD